MRAPNGVARRAGPRCGSVPLSQLFEDAEESLRFEEAESDLLLAFEVLGVRALAKEPNRRQCVLALGWPLRGLEQACRGRTLDERARVSDRG